jgi:multiple sugar transport system substrate-binding protein
VLAALGLAACGAGSGGSGSGKSISIWEGWTGAEQKEFTHLVSVYEKANPGVKVNYLYVNNDNTLQKVLTAVRGGTLPDIAYLYGSWAPNIAKIPQVVNLTSVVAKPSVHWSDFWVGERNVATVNGKVIGIPALVDNLAVVYNKTLFAQAGLKPPAANWTWSQFQADAKALTNPAIKQYGTAYVTPGSEDTVWHWEALLWEAGGQILNSSNTKAAFDSAAGLASLNTLRTMAVTDHSMYLDPADSAYANLFNSGKLGMVVTGPWDLSGFPNVQYGVQVMPEYPGTGGGHQTIAGPDNWVMFNNGAAQVSAAQKFLLWLTATPQAKAWSLATGDLPIRASVANSPGFAGQMNTALPGVNTFVSNLGNVKQSRPQLATYPQISQALGQMIVSVLLGKSEPKAALAAAAAKVNAILAGSGG